MMSSDSSYCRFCAKLIPNSSTQDLKVRNNMLLSKVIQRLQVFREIIVDFSNETLPETVCNLCYDSLEKCYEFFTQVKKSQELLVELCKIEVSSVESEAECYEAVTTWSSYRWQCIHCEAYLRSLEALREHSRTAHSTCLSYKCADCNHRPSSYQEFVQHVRTHRESLRNYCEFCNMTIEDDDTHYEIHINDVKCVFCGEVFNDRAALLAHKTYMPESITWSEYPLRCKFCKSKFKDRDALVDHCISEHDTCCGWQCDDCDKTQVTFIEFVKHVHQHRPKLVSMCPYCDTDMGGFYDFAHVSMHLAGCHPCMLCGKIYQYKSSLLCHEARTGTSTELPVGHKPDPYTCVMCGKTLKKKNKRAIRKHLLQKHTQRNFDCESCNRSFQRYKNLRNHIYKYSQNDRERCYICHKNITKKYIKEHMEVVHHMGVMKGNIYECSTCKKQFRTKSKMIYHLKRHTKPVLCKYCGKGFAYNYLLEKHLRMWHKNRGNIDPAYHSPDDTESVITWDASGQFPDKADTSSHFKNETDIANPLSD